MVVFLCFFEPAQNGCPQEKTDACARLFYLDSSSALFVPFLSSLLSTGLELLEHSFELAQYCPNLV